jgi:hypothetical protein
MTSGVGLAIPDGRTPVRTPPALVHGPHMLNGLGVGVKEEVSVLEASRAHEPLAQSELSFQHGDRSRAQRHAAVFGALGSVTIDARFDTKVCAAKNARCNIGISSAALNNAGSNAICAFAGRLRASFSITG